MSFDSGQDSLLDQINWALFISSDTLLVVRQDDKQIKLYPCLF